jgi:hypothetical protein
VTVLAEDLVRDPEVLGTLRDVHWVSICRDHPAFFANRVRCVDSRSGEIFQFQMLSRAEALENSLEYHGDDWRWQREYLDWVLENPQTITLKGRQLGVTWVWAMLCLYDALFTPGADILIYSIKEEDAVEVVNRIWDMWLSIEHLAHLFPVKVIKPTRGVRPSTVIAFEHGDGRVSTITGMAATKSAGHGRSAKRILFDEAARQDYARELWKAVIPAMGDSGGSIGVVSTANGMSDGKGQGNFFHELWEGAGKTDYPKLKKTFLRWSQHPHRDQAWYDSVSLGQAEKAEQYPNDPDEAFLLSGSPYFDVHSLKFFSSIQPKPEGYCRFEAFANNPSRAELRWFDGAPIELYRRPEPGKEYAIFADVATGQGLDYSVGAVIDLSDGAPCAELYMKADYEQFSEQLHFLGVWFNNARIAVEKGGGYGDVVIGHLRDGHKGRKPYPRLYRHRSWDHPTRPTVVQFGYPMTLKTRPHVVAALREWINDRLLPYMTPGWLSECNTFVHRETKPSPRAADGCNDDRVMAWGGALVLYGEFGEFEHHRKKQNLKNRRKPKPTSALDPRARSR